MITKHSYKVMVGDADGFAVINDQNTRVGNTVQMTERQAKYLLMGGIIAHHPLDHDRDGKLGGKRPPTITDLTAPAEPVHTHSTEAEGGEVVAEETEEPKPRGRGRK